MIHKKNLAQLYDFLFGSINQDFEFYKFFIEKNNGPALEIGSGTGRLLLKYLKLGLNIEGIEPNQDMIDICSKKTESNIQPIIYSQKLQNLNLEKKYKTIYMPLFVFQHILEKNEIFAALSKIYEHLEIDGQVLISIFIPWNDPTATLEQTWRIAKISRNNNLNIILSESIKYDKFEQIQTKHLKYEIFENGYLKESLYSKSEFRCYSIFELTILLQQIGFKRIEIFGDYEIQKAHSENEVFIFSSYK